MMIILTNLQAKSAYKYKVPGVHTLNVSYYEKEFGIGG